MRRMILRLAGAAILTAGFGSAGLAAGKMRFWNMTADTIVELYLAPAGTDKWSANQCDNDADKSVDPDERLALTGIAAGRYDVKLKNKKGRTCLVHDVEVKGDGPYAFSLAEDQLRDCQK